MKPHAGNDDTQERKRLLELVAFARRTPDCPGFTWWRGVYIGLATLSLFAALRCWTTWRSFHRPVEVVAELGITAAEQSAMLAAIRTNSTILDPVAMDATTFHTVLLGRGRIERSVRFARDGKGTQAIVYRRNGGAYSWRWGEKFDFDAEMALTGSSTSPTMLIH